MNLYITHCSGTKNDNLKGTGEKVTPDRLYTGPRKQSFMEKCKELDVRWAIFSDLYGVWFSEEKHEWYEKDPNEIVKGQEIKDPEKFKELLNESEKRLKSFDIVCFYGNHKSRYFHPLYRRLIDELKNRGLNIVLISHLYDIKK
jgi:hypothetical protein